jgi:E3 ubiquitin-protein ligase SHPRH
MAPLKLTILGTLLSPANLLESAFPSVSVPLSEDEEERPRKRVKLESVGEDKRDAQEKAHEEIHEEALTPKSDKGAEDVVPIAAIEFRLRLSTVLRLLSEHQSAPLKYAMQKGMVELRNICDKGQIVGTIQPDEEIMNDVLRIFAIQSKISACKLAKSHSAYLEAQQNDPVFIRSIFRSQSAPNTATLRVEVHWRSGRSHLDLGKNGKELASLLESIYWPNMSSGTWSPQDFYRNVHVPSPETPLSRDLEQDKLLECSLYPFQKRTVQFMVEREKTPHETATSSEIRSDRLPASYRQDVDLYGNPVFVSSALGTIHKHRQNIPWPDVRGGILAEEMGLGKTVELIALMRLHKAKLSDTSTEIFDSDLNRSLTPTKATLIVTPWHLLNQWEDELALHSPQLNVFHYRGMRQESKSQKMKDQFFEADVVLVTYFTLAKEIYFTGEQHDRGLRHAKRYTPRRSTLVDMLWWRVCLDEAQTVENGLSHSAIVARTIPRVNAWAISGTPFRQHVKDLLGLLTFLKYEPYCDRKVWQRLDKDSFKAIVSSIAIRHTKEKVRHEIRLPKQTRVVMTMPFSAIEEQNYDTLFQNMCQDCGLYPDGSPTSDEYDPQSPQLLEKMRNWLRRLRQTCLHPEVGGRNRRALGRGTHAPLRTVDEVLEHMIQGNEASVRVEERVIFMAKITRGHITAFDKSNTNRQKDSLLIYSDALQQADRLVSDCRRILEAETVKVEPSDEAKTDIRLGPLRLSLRSALEMQHIANFYVGTAYFQMKEALNPDKHAGDRIQAGSDNAELPLDPSMLDTTVAQDGSLKEELKRSEEYKNFPEYKQLESHETQHYDTAKLIRKELLSENKRKAEESMASIHGKALVDVPVIHELDFEGGIENIKFMDKFQILRKTVNEQGVLIGYWRQKARDLLLKPLLDTDKDEEQTGEEYQDSTKEQDELYVLFQIMRTLAAERQGWLSGQINALTQHEAKFAISNASSGEGHAPELLLKFKGEWDRVKARSDRPSLRGLIAELRGLSAALEWQAGERPRAAAELGIVDRQIKHFQKVMTLQNDTLTNLEKELDLFRVCMNRRLEYYRQLQALSDQVAPYRDELVAVLDIDELKRQVSQENLAEQKLSSLRTKGRFFLHLRNESNMEEPKICVICQSSFDDGVLTVCGHQYCTECIQMWYSEHRTCPVCKKHLRAADFHPITYKVKEIRAEAEEEHAPNSPSASRASESAISSRDPASIYSEISQTALQEIKAIDLPGAVSYGTKIDMLARHLIWLREYDPNAKSIIFSQYSDFLQILGRALTSFKIGWSSISQHSGIKNFRRSPEMECFLLDAKSDSSGLNLINATHVFLCEPLVNPAIELQAIARVHRIGQMRNTTVWMSLIADSVEEAVYRLSVGRRLAHMARRSETMNEDELLAKNINEVRPDVEPPEEMEEVQETALDAANSEHLQTTAVSKLLVSKGKSGGEIVGSEDLWTCLFSSRPRTTQVMSKALNAEIDRHLRAEAVHRRRIATDGM